MKGKTCAIVIIIMLLTGCSSPKEVVYPFINFSYSGERLFPVSKNDADFSFRAWVSCSTSIDRVFTVSYSKDLGYSGQLLEIRGHNLNSKTKDKTTFKEINIKPTSGFEKFISKVDSLSLMEVRDQDEKNFSHAMHEPFSMFVIEIKNHGKFNQFKFYTNFPSKGKVEDIFEKIQQLIFQEFDFKFYFDS
jgi:hypothetical protein